MTVGVAANGPAALERCCASCGYRCASSLFFRQESEKFFARRKTYCAACAAPRQSPAAADRLSEGIVTTFVLVWLIVIVTYDATSDVVASTVGVVMSFMVSPLIHELGHAAFATNASVHTLRIGSGPILKSWQVKTVKVDLRLFFFAGGGTLLRPRPPDSAKWRRALFVLGGPLANALLALVAFFAMWWSENPLAVAAWCGIALAQAALLVTNLIPVRCTDGARLLELFVPRRGAAKAPDETVTAQLAEESSRLTSAHRYEDAIRYCEAAIREHPHSSEIPRLFSQVLHSLMKSRGPRAAVDYYRAHQHLLVSIAADWLSWIYANVAWGAFLTGDPVLLPLADELSGKALAGLPAVPETKGTRGAVLVERGDHERGIALLTDAVRGIEGQDDDRAEFVAWWANGERARGNFAMAEELARYRHYLLDRLAQQAPPQAV